MPSSSSTGNSERNCPNTPSARNQYLDNEGEDLSSDKFEQEWDAFVARHRAYEEKRDQEATVDSAKNTSNHLIDEETWNRHKQQQQSNYRKRQKKKETRQNNRKKVTTLKRS